MLDDRKTAILSAVVHEYIATAQPVGSSHLVDAPGVGVSSATVRNELAHLEQEGFLVQPHTSAGRIPTDKGYRYFVDNLTTPGPLDSAQTAQIGDFFTAAHGRLEEMLHQTSDLLATLTNSTSLVVGPTPAEVEVRSVQLVPLSSTHATVVVVFSNGAVESSTIELSVGCDDERLADASAVLSHNLVGKKLSQVTTIDGVENIAVAALAAMARDAV
ncbi:MAG: heat-inducible transcriptional repressor HrcA, partial [Actinomycetota bacterium]|nr:heat-inducible transcriptional repressor HrcA [Actinomycetota bacterium]